MSGELVVLLAENDPGDAELVRLSLEQGKLKPRLEVVSDGAAAMAYLRRAPPYSAKPAPDLLLLNPDLPKKDGWEVLREIRADAELAGLPIVILARAAAEEDVLRGYRLGANCFIPKPERFEDLAKTVRLIADFWLGAAKLPKRGASASRGGAGPRRSGES